MHQPLVVLIAATVLLFPADARPQTATPGQRFPDESPHRERFVVVAGGVRLQILDWGGQGPVLLFVPGLGQTAHIFDGLAPGSGIATTWSE